MEGRGVHGEIGVSSRLAIIVTVLALVAAACGASDAEETATTASVGQAPDETTDQTVATVPDSEIALEFATISLPDGLRPWWESTSRTQTFGDSNFLLAASSDVAIRGEDPGLVVLRLDSALEWSEADVTIPRSTKSADMYMTGSQLVISYLDEEGEIVVASSTDGAAFAETRMPLPERYIAADECAHTSLIGNLAGAADLNGTVLAIANTGIRWKRPVEIAQAYAIEQNPAAAESIRFAGTIRTKPTGDGDSLFVFENGGEVVAEVLGSDAGIESGYAEAFRDRGDDTFEIQSWTIDGDTATNLNVAPFNGKEGLRIHALYPVDDGVAAMVTDFNFAEEAAEANQQGQTFARRDVATPGASAIRMGESGWRLVPWLTYNGIAWMSQAPIDVRNPQFASFAWALYEGIPLFILVLFADGMALMAASADGRNFGATGQDLGIAEDHGGEVATQVTGADTVAVYSSGDGRYQEFGVEIHGDGTPTAEQIRDLEIEPIDHYELAKAITELTGKKRGFLPNIGQIIGDILLTAVPSN